MSNHEHLARMCKTLLDSLLASSSKNTLCLNIFEKAFAAEKYVAEQLAASGKTNVTTHDEPTPTEFGEILDGISGKISVVQFADLDKSPKCLDLLLEHVKKADPGGKLVIVSSDWNSDNTAKEVELRKNCLFYTQAAPAKEPKTKEPKKR
jgi:hypothetical protein